MPKSNNWTFKTWIENFKAVDLPIGDLAQDILNDPDFPEDDYFTSMIEHLQNKRANSTVIEVFCFAWNYYLVSNATPDGLL